MNESPSTPATPAAETGAVAVGRRLREAREAMGADIGALAAAVKVPVPKLQALEAGQLDRLPDLAFARALVASICRLLRIESAPLLAQLPRAAGRGLSDDVPALSGRLHPAAPPARSVTASRGFPRPLLWGGLALLLGAAALALALAPGERLHQWAGLLRGGDAPPAAGGAVIAQEAVAPAAAVPAAPGGAVADAAVSQPAPSPAVPPVASAPDGVARVPAAPAAAAPVAAPAADVAVPLLLRARSDTWVKVTDARGAVVLQKLLVQGNEERVDAPLPLNVVIGRADAAEVLVRGQPFDTATNARSNVARFQVK